MSGQNSIAELDVLQVSFNTALRVFMKSPSGDAFKLVEQYNYLKKMRSGFSPELRVNIVTIPKKFDLEFPTQGLAYKITRLMRDKAFSVQSFVCSFIIHGSYATRDFISDWSDLDAMVILKDSVFDSVDNLIKVKKVFLRIGLLCYWIDPLAHHQLSFITEFDLNYYPQSFLPLPSYEHAVLLLGQEKINFNVRDDAFEQEAMIERFRNWFRRKVEAKNWSKNQYDWKNDIARVFLLPSLLLQTKGVYVYKKDSFIKAKQFFNDFDMRPIEEATDIMRNWKAPNFVKYLPPRLIMSLPYRIARVIVTAARKPALSMRPVKNFSEIERLTKEFLRLYEYKK